MKKYLGRIASCLLMITLPTFLYHSYSMNYRLGDSSPRDTLWWVLTVTDICLCVVAYTAQEPLSAKEQTGD